VEAGLPRPFGGGAEGPCDQFDLAVEFGSDPVNRADEGSGAAAYKTHAQSRHAACSVASAQRFCDPTSIMAFNTLRLPFSWACLSHNALVEFLKFIASMVFDQIFGWIV
jgi:hypothetical protein